MNKILEKLQCPADLNQLSISQHSSNNGQEVENHKRKNQIKISKKMQGFKQIETFKNKWWA